MARARCGEGCANRWARLKGTVLDGRKERTRLCLVHRAAAAAAAMWMSLERDYTGGRNIARGSSVPSKIVGCECCSCRTLEIADQQEDYYRLTFFCSLFSRPWSALELPPSTTDGILEPIVDLLMNRYAMAQSNRDNVFFSTHLLKAGLWFLDTYKLVRKPKAYDEILGPFKRKLLRIAANGALRSPLEFR